MVVFPNSNQENDGILQKSAYMGPKRLASLDMYSEDHGTDLQSLPLYDPFFRLTSKLSM